MATSKFFTVDVRPTIPASIQHLGAFSAGDVLFDWTAVQIPKGSALLRSVTALVRPKGDATPTANRFSFDLLFSSTDTVSLGTLHAATVHTPSNDFLGRIEFETANYAHGSLQSTAIATSGKGSNSGMDLGPLVLTPKMTDPVNYTYQTPGFDTVYVGAIATDAFDFSSITAIAEDTAAGNADSQAITTDGTSMDNTEHFIAGDVLHIGTSVGEPLADSLIGTVDSVAARTITLTDTSATALVDGDILYNIHPIKLILSFER